MTRYFISRSASLCALVAVLVFTSAASLAQSQSATAACDRACLRQVLDAYLEAVFKHDPAAAPLTADHFATSNTIETKLGDGFWKSVTGYGEVQRRWFDTHNQSAAFYGIVKKNGDDRTTSLRIRVDGREVSEAEWVFSTQRDDPVPVGGSSGSLGNAELLVKHPPPEGLLPVSERSSRFYLIAIANNYFQGVAEHDASWIPQDPRCLDEDGPIASVPRRGDICHDDFEKFRFITKDLALRRIPVVDEEAGVVLGIAIFQRYPGVTRQDNFVHEYFYVRNGTISDVWTAPYYLPFRGPVTTGWENR